MRNDPRKSTPDPESPQYEPPQVEQVIGAEEIAREVHYAGDIRPSDLPVG